MSHLKYTGIEDEFVFRATRSQGPGGQNVNKVNSRIELRFKIRESKVLSIPEKEQLEQFYRSKVTASGEIIITAQASRSQPANKEEAIKRFFLMLDKALTPVTVRMPTKATRLSIKKRLEAKKQRSNKKKSRVNRDLTFE
jgi:ribosome-associated protein